MKVPQKTYELLPAGEYPAIIADIVQESGQYGEQLKFTFDLTGQYEGRSLLGWASAKFSKRSKLYRWVQGAWGIPIPKTYDFDSDGFIGREVRLVVTTKNTDNGEYNRVEDLLPPAREAPPAPIAPPAPPVPPMPEQIPDEPEEIPF